jgi:molybdenum cofactor synthesis domain-containing protein
MTKNKTAAFLIIGNEILSGRTKDANLNYLANFLNSLGINFLEARVVGDDEDEIILGINELRKKYDYVFTSGGIGPTHDDITYESIAKAFGVSYELNKKAEKILHDFYGKDGVNESRLKMAYLPKGCELLKNSISSAPGCKMENVFILAGIPKIFQVMLDASKEYLKTGEKEKSKEIKINLTESVIAKDLTNLQKKYPQVLMGSYPFDGGTALVFRSVNYEILDNVISEAESILRELSQNCIIK